MTDLKDRAVQLARSVVYGYLVVALSALAVVLIVAFVASVTGAPSFDLGVGPLRLLTFWRSDASYGFTSGSGTWVLGIAGALAGLGLGLRRQPSPAA